MTRVAIIGTGKIGTDLMFKVLKSSKLKLYCVYGRRSDSEGIKIAQQNNVLTSIDGLEGIEHDYKNIDLVFDCTDAFTARANAPVFKKLGIKVIDLTPAKVGDMCVPYTNEDINEIKKLDNINMITCGGQTSIPLLSVISHHFKIDYIEVVSQIASKSAGIATRDNIDDYIHTTEKAITKFTGCDNTKVILNLNPAEPEVSMQTTMFLKIKNIHLQFNREKIEQLTNIINSRIENCIHTYIPGYELIVPPTIGGNDILMLTVKVTGQGLYLPKYSGNLDIINAASIKIAEGL